MEPKIIIEDTRGRHNTDPETEARLKRSKSYRDLSTICIRPCVGPIWPRVVQSWEGLMTPMNQKFLRMTVMNMEVGQAYNSAIESILANPDLSQWKFILTLEHDNCPPCDGLLKLYENIDDYDAIGGCYWTKGIGGQPMIYGDPCVVPLNFIPQMPKPEQVQPCNGLGMGFTLFKLDLFKRMPKPWFVTKQDFTPGVGAQSFTQDLWFFNELRKAGGRVACDTRVKVGHYEPPGPSPTADTMW